MFTVYRILNQENGKSYIGITSRTAQERFEEHLSRTKGFVLLRRLNDHPEREYAQAGGSGVRPDSSRSKIWSALHGNVQQPETAGRA